MNVFTDLTDLAVRTEVPKEELDGILRRLVEIHDPLRVYLFGSFVWGTPHWNSDLDFCVVVKTQAQVKAGLKKASQAFEGFTKTYTDFFISSKKEMEKRISNPATLEHRIFYGAELLYEKQAVKFNENRPLYRIETEILENADENLDMCRRAFDKNPRIKSSLYHVQQCIEHSLRAFRAFHLQPLIKTHELKFLRRLCGKIEPSILKIEGFSTRKDAERLSDYYWLRYSNQLSKQVRVPGVLGTERAIQTAECVYEFVKHYIETTEPPTEPTI